VQFLNRGTVKRSSSSSTSSMFVHIRPIYLYTRVVTVDNTLVILVSVLMEVYFFQNVVTHAVCLSVCLSALRKEIGLSY